MFLFQLNIENEKMCNKIKVCAVAMRKNIDDAFDDASFCAVAQKFENVDFTAIKRIFLIEY